MTDRAYVAEAVLRYLRQPNTDYALLVTGPWGCGKTHFWKTTIAQQVKSQNLEPLYVSLYGLERATDIDRLLLIAQFPVLKNGMFEAFAKLTKSGLDYFNIRLPFGGIKADLEKKVLCFDDLERSSTSAKVSDVLGYINSLVEHDRRKVIVLANEDEIKDERYLQIKEKLFRFIYKFESALSDIPDSWLTEGVESSALIGFLQSKRALMLRLLRASQSENLRSLAAAIDLFKVVWAESNEHQSDQAAIWEAVLRAVFAITFELKRDYALKDTLVVLFKESDTAWWRFTEGDEHGEGKDVLIEVERKYFSDQACDSTKFRSVFDLVADGIFRPLQFKAEFQSARQTLESQGHDIDSLFLTRYWDLTDDEFKRVSGKKLAEIDAGSVVRPAEIVRQAKVMFPLARHGLLGISGEELRDKYLKQLDGLRRSGRAQYSGLEAYISGYPFPDLADTDYQQVRDRALEIDKEAERRTRLARLNDLAAKLSKDTAGVLKELVEGDDVLARYPIMCEIGAQLLYDQIIGMTPSDVIKFRNFIENRYEARGIDALLSADSDCLSQLAASLESYTAGSEKKLSTHAINVLVESLKRAHKNLNAERPS